MTSHIKAGGIVAAFIALCLAITGGTYVYGSAVQTEAPALANQYRSYQFFASSTLSTLNATSTTATSTNIVAYFDSNGQRVDGSLNIAGAKAVNLIATRGDSLGTGNTGSSVVKFQVTTDGTTWLDYNDLRQVSATSTANINRLGIIPFAAGTSTVMYSMNTLGFLKLRCINVETTDGDVICEASAQY